MLYNIYFFTSKNCILKVQESLKHKRNTLKEKYTEGSLKFLQVAVKKLTQVPSERRQQINENMIFLRYLRLCKQ